MCCTVIKTKNTKFVTNFRILLILSHVVLYIIYIYINMKYNSWINKCFSVFVYIYIYIYIIYIIYIYYIYTYIGICT